MPISMETVRMAKSQPKKKNNENGRIYLKTILRQDKMYRHLLWEKFLW